MRQLFRRLAHWSDAALLEAVEHGQDTALAELLKRHGPQVLAHARRLGVPDPVGALQEVFARLARDAACARRSPLAARDWLLLHAGHTLSRLIADGESSPALPGVPIVAR